MVGNTRGISFKTMCTLKEHWKGETAMLAKVSKTPAKHSVKITVIIELCYYPTGSWSLQPGIKRKVEDYGVF